MLKFNKEKFAGKHLLFRTQLALVPHLIDIPGYPTKRVYSISVFLHRASHKICYYMRDLTEFQLYDYTQSIPKGLVNTTGLKVLDQPNIEALKSYTRSKLQYIYVEDHLMLFHTGDSISFHD